MLTRDEDKRLVEQAVEMANTGYRQTPQQIREMVKNIFEKDHRPNPFKENKPGKNWWYSVLQENPEIAFRATSPSEMPRASACNEETLLRWYTKLFFSFTFVTVTKVDFHSAQNQER